MARYDVRLFAQFAFSIGKYCGQICFARKVFVNARRQNFFDGVFKVFGADRLGRAGFPSSVRVIEALIASVFLLVASARVGCAAH